MYILSRVHQQGKLVQGCGVYISTSVHHKESCYKVAKFIYHHVCITRKVVVKLQNVYIITSASQGKLLKSCGMLISLRVHHKESCYQVAECISLHVCITMKVLVKLRNVDIITCASQGKLVEGCGMYISTLVRHKESCHKVTECIYHHVYITRKVLIKLGNVYIITCASNRKLL